MLEIKNITKKFNKNVVLDNISFNLEKGKIYGLLGRNSAGKSTILNIICNRIFANSGEILLDNQTLTENDLTLNNIYLMSEDNLYPKNMKIKEIFKWSKEFYPNFNVEYAKNLCEKFNLNLNKKISNLSTGYNSIAKIIIALSVNTDFVFLDEPVLGLDVNHRDLFYKLLIENYSENGTSFIISTHLIEEISHLIEHTIIIKSGSIIIDKQTETLLNEIYIVSGSDVLVDEYIENKDVLSTSNLCGIKNAYIWGTFPNNEKSANLTFSKCSLQDLFINLTNV